MNKQIAIYLVALMAIFSCGTSKKTNKVKKCEIDLNKPAKERWRSCISDYKDDIKALLNFVDKRFGQTRLAIELELETVAKNPKNFLDEEM